MKFYKTAESTPGDYAGALAQANQMVALEGGEIVGVIDTIPNEVHILVCKGSGQRARIYFDGPAEIGKAAPTEIDPTLAATLLAALAKQNSELEVKKESDMRNAAATNAAIKKASEVTKTEVTKTPADFTAKVAEIKARGGYTNQQAMTKARTEDPVAFAAYQQGPTVVADVPSADAIAKAATSKAALDAFEVKCQEIYKRDGGKRTDALQKARIAFPKEFAAAFANA